MIQRSMRRGGVSVLLFAVPFFVPPAGAQAQEAAGAVQARATASEYRRAEQFLGWNARTLVSADTVDPVWLEDDRFWYRNRRFDGTEFVLVDPDRGTREPAFDHARLAAALSVAADTSYEPYKLPFEEFELRDGDQTLHLILHDTVAWECDLTGYTCSGPEVVEEDGAAVRPSPDGRWVAFQRNHNLWVRNTESGEEIGLSEDGRPWYGYGDRPEGCCSVVTDAREGVERPPVLAWSPDGRTVVTHRVDRRGVRELALVETDEDGPILHTYRNGLPGDSIIPTLALHFFHLGVPDIATTDGDAPQLRHVPVRKDPQDMVNTACCQVVLGDTLWRDVQWGSTGRSAFFTHGERGFKRLELVVADAETGETRTILEETSPTWVELTQVSGGMPNWRVIRDDREVIWFSQRDGWGHLYRIDVADGRVLNRITEGPWLVMELLHVEEPEEWVYFTAVGREAGRDPYFRHLYRARIDGGDVQLLTPEDADHDVHVSPSGQYVVDAYSTRTSPPVTVLRDASGTVLQTLEEADVSQLLDAGWQWPTPFTIKARDGVTDLHGLLYFPSAFDPERRYPVVDYIYPGPQVGPIGTRGFSIAPRGNAHALAELGFIVFTIDALGTPGRSKAFHDHYYGDMGDNGIADHIAAMRALALRYPQMDLDRVGIFGHSGGGFSSTGAILRFPDFFKAAVSTAGNHDNRSYDYTWGEKYQGLRGQDSTGTDSFDSQANHRLADRLEGQLLLMYGTLDDNVHPNANLLLIDELIRHNKDFDLVVLPNRNHGFANEPYVIRRTWDYFVRHLQGREPPSGVEISGPPDR